MSKGLFTHCASLITFIIQHLKLKINTKAPYIRALITCPSGGIGRRACFRSMWPHGREGSSPFLGTFCFVIG